jgi:hypothetical protein
MPTLTQVPVESLKFSATRPSKTMPFEGSAGSAKRAASPVLNQPSSKHCSVRSGRVADRLEQKLVAGRRQADDAGAVDGEMAARHHGRRLGEAPRGDHRRDLAARRERARLEPLPLRLRQGCGGVEDDAQAGEEVAVEGGVGLEVVEEARVAAGHVEI